MSRLGQTVRVSGSGSGSAFRGARIALIGNTSEPVEFWGTVPFDCVVFDTESIADIANHRFIVPMAGLWRFAFQILGVPNGDLDWDEMSAWIYTGGTDGAGFIHSMHRWDGLLGSLAEWFGNDPVALSADTGPVVVSAGTTLWVHFHTVLSATMGGSNDSSGTGAECYFTAEYLGPDPEPGS